MELQIRSTLNVLRSAITDKNIHIHGLRFLISICSQNSGERDISNCPVVETILSSLKSFPDNTSIKMLCCSVLLSFSQYQSCVEEAKKFGLIEMMSKYIAIETDPTIISLELAVMSSYGVHDILKGSFQSSEVYSTIARIEVKWQDDPAIFQQLLGIFMILSADKYAHHDIIQLKTIKTIPAFLSKYQESYEIIRGIINICYNLSQSKEGKRFLARIHIIPKILPFFNKLPIESQLCCCVAKLLVALNQDKSYRKDVVSLEGCELAIALLNRAQTPAARREGMIAIRSICSAERDSIAAVVSTHVLTAICATLKAYPEDVLLCTHGFRAVEWILQTGQSTVVRGVIDEGLLALCSDILPLHHQIDCTRFLCGCLAKIIKFSMNISYVVKHMEECQILQRFQAFIHENRTNESLMIECSKLLATVCSNRETLALLVRTELLKEIVLIASSCQTPETAMLVTGILWKCCLEDNGRKQILQYNGVDAVLKLLQYFIHNLVIHRNGLGCLSLLIQGDPSVCDGIRRRLGLSLVFDSMETFMQNPEYCIQVLTFLQYMSTDANCYRVMLDHTICAHVLALLRVQQQNITVSTMCFVLLDSLLGEDEGLYQLCSQEGVGELMKTIIARHEVVQPDVGKLGNDVLKKLSLFNAAL